MATLRTEKKSRTFLFKRMVTFLGFLTLGLLMVWLLYFLANFILYDCGGDEMWLKPFGGAGEHRETVRQVLTTGQWVLQYQSDQLILKNLKNDASLNAKLGKSVGESLIVDKNASQRSLRVQWSKSSLGIAQDDDFERCVNVNVTARFLWKAK